MAIHSPCAVASPLRDKALRAINNYLETVDMSTEGTLWNFFKSLGTSKEILDLYNSSDIPTFAQSLIGKKKISTIEKAQLSLVYPAPLNAKKHTITNWHIDSIAKNDGGGYDWSPNNFTLLVGVFLSDMPTPGCGNLTVRPGGHRVMAEHFKSHGTEYMLDAYKHINLSAPREICAKAGDVAIVHHLLPHTLGFNTSPNIRYMCYFRLRTVGRPYFF